MPHLPTRPTGLGQQPSVFESAFDRIINAVDQVAPGARGEIVHQYLLRNGFFDNPERAAALFQEVPEIDSYLDNVNITAALQNEPTGLTGEQIVAVTIGFGLGLGVAYLFTMGSASRDRSSQRRIPEGR